MIQYKAMENEPGGPAFRLPNDQLAEEISRMDNVFANLRACAADRSLQGFRLNDNPFFLKFCPRITLDPDDAGLVKGMYFPLDYWRRLERDGATVGSHGGRKATYQNAGRYFTNTEFASLVAKAWVGSTANQSAALEEIIRDTIASGKAVALALRKNDQGGTAVLGPRTPDKAG